MRFRAVIRELVLVSRTLLLAEYFFSVKREERWVRRQAFVWNQQRLALESSEAAPNRVIVRGHAQLFAHYEPKVFVERDKPSIECSVVYSRQTEAVLWVQTFGRMRTPRQNVASDEQFAHFDSRKTARAVESIKEHLLKELLAAPDRHFRSCFRWTSRRREALSSAMRAARSVISGMTRLYEMTLREQVR
jgi:hypothetical protein